MNNAVIVYIVSKIKSVINYMNAESYSGEKDSTPEYPDDGWRYSEGSSGCEESLLEQTPMTYEDIRRGVLERSNPLQRHLRACK